MSWHTAPPAFNPYYDPKHAPLMQSVAAAMDAEGYYDTHTRDECATELRRRMAEQREN